MGTAYMYPGLGAEERELGESGRKELIRTRSLTWESSTCSFLPAQWDAGSLGLLSVRSGVTCWTGRDKSGLIRFGIVRDGAMMMNSFMI